MKVLVYLPALDEEDNVHQVISALPKVLPDIDTAEYLVVNDGSTDRTAAIASESGAVVISHHHTRGVGAAFQTAVKYAIEAKADILVSIDADGQFDPEEMPALVTQIIHNHADMVTGNRFHDGKPANMSAVKYMGNKIIACIISWISGTEFTDVSCGYRAYAREALYHLTLFGSFTYTHEAILKLLFKGLRVVEIPIFVRYDTERKSRVAGNVLRYAYQASKIIFRIFIDYHPMRIFGTMGVINILVGAVFVFYMLAHYFIVGSFSPYKSYGFIGLGFALFGMLVFLVGFVADMINRSRKIQDEILYEIMKSKYQ